MDSTRTKAQNSVTEGEINEVVEVRRPVVLGLFATGIVQAGQPRSPPNVPQPIEIDTSSHFATDREENDRDELIKWARSVSQSLRFAIIVRRSDSGEKRKAQLVLECERSGKYVPAKKKLKSDTSGTRKCECPFRLRGYYNKATKLWRLTVVNGMHNHELDKGLEGHLVAGRLKPQEKEFMDEMTRNAVAPKNILSTLKERDPENKTSAKQVYNARHRYRVKMRASMTEMQHLCKKLDDNKYYYKYRTVVENGVEHLQDIFFAHPRSITLFNSFHTVLMMDSTYKTSKYKMPLFEIVGFTSTEKTFNVAFAWLSNEKEDNFIWALQQLRCLLRRETNLPKVILTDRDLALMNAIPAVFPEAAALVCRFHVKKNVRTKAVELVKVRDGEKVKAADMRERVCLAFEDVLDSSTEAEYTENVMAFRKLCERWPKFVRYVEETILDTDKEKLVSAWVDKHMHMGNHTTNRAESAHGVLKSYLTDGLGDLVKGWESIHRMLGNQFTQVQTEFGQNMSVYGHTYRKKTLYSTLMFKISRRAMRYIHTESKRVEFTGMDSMKCGCLMRTNYGLPCACLIAKKLHHNRPIRLDEVYKHWKIICFQDEEVGGDVEDDYACTAEWQAIQERLRTADVSMKNEIRDQLRKIAYPTTTDVEPPNTNVKSKGAKKKKVVRGTRSTSRDKSRWEHVEEYFTETQASQSSKPSPSIPSHSRPSSSQPTASNPMPTVSEAPLTVSNPLPLTSSSQIFGINHMPKFMHPFIEDIINVDGDGYCGYRAVALAQRGNEDDFELIRCNMSRELRLNKDMYVAIFGCEERYQYICDALLPPPRTRQRTSIRNSVAPMDKWFTLPDMGHIVATILDRVVVQLSILQNGPCETFFPLRSIPSPNPSSRVICLGALPDHYVLVKLKVGCPIPKSNKSWKQYCAKQSLGWEDSFIAAQHRFEEMMSTENVVPIQIVGAGSRETPLVID
ncbi:PKS-NRPS hybrid synthetase cheA-like [Trifolium pratense]|uniref:PKS-NRPS hybrid synthetase cheA-like n=1 Tax=Trifolium pratense TaxID=57577 RepID=UPI001E695118|nr:PKS-NRPS hybrid synthetase cheA-like [Trifolium pratense]